MRLRSLGRLRNPSVRRRIRDATAEELFGDPRSLGALLGINVVAFLVGVRFYVETLTDVPTLLWPLYADSPVAIALATLALATLLPTVGSGERATDAPTNRALAYLHTLAFVWLVKYGLWPLVALNVRADLYVAAPGAVWDYWGIVGTHLLFVGLALLLPAVARTTRGALATALGLALLNDLLDYGFGYHPPLRYEPGLLLPAISVGFSVVAVALAARSFRRLPGSDTEP